MDPTLDPRLPRYKVTTLDGWIRRVQVIVGPDIHLSDVRGFPWGFRPRYMLGPPPRATGSLHGFHGLIILDTLGPY